MKKVLTYATLGAIQLMIAVPVLVVGWWLFNFAVYVYDGTTIPMWTDFNKAVFGR